MGTGYRSCFDCYRGKVVEKLRAEGISKEDIGREKFLEHVWDWKKQYGGRIVEQLKKIGSSCDWDRERFTMDEGCSKAVKEVFVKLYNKDLIYRGERIINWCPKCLTSISDAEVEYEDQAGHFGICVIRQRTEPVILTWRQRVRRHYLVIRQ